MILALVLLAQGIAGYGSIQLPPPPQQITAGHRDFVSIRDFNAPCDGVNDDVPALTSAISNRLPASGGTVDARGCALLTIGTTLTISKAAVTILLPVATISMGANQIIVPVGVHNVALIGAVPYGGSIAGANGTFLTYTGTGNAIQVGDATGDTYGFHLQDITIGLSTAGSAAIGIQLNRCPMYSLTRPRVHGSSSANTQIAIDLEGGAQFTGGRIDDPYLWQGTTGILFGQNANANYVVGGIIINSGTLAGLCFNLAGAAGGLAVGNVIIGTDCEAGVTSGTVLSIDRASKNYVYGVRNESVVTYVTATANSNRNVVIGWSAGAVSDLSAGNSNPNSIVNVDYWLMNQSLWQMRNRADAAVNLTLWSGATAGQSTNINLLKFDGSRAWEITKDSSDVFHLIDNANTADRIRIDQSTNTFINSIGVGNRVLFNDQANTGTGGVCFGSGGASPSCVASFDNTGKLAQTGVAFASLGTPANGSLLYCTDCAIANPCAGAGTGAFAKRLNGVWVCN